MCLYKRNGFLELKGAQKAPGHDLEFEKDLKKILDRIETLAQNPRPPGCEKLTGQQRYRFRQGRYRILYSVQDDELTIWVVTVGQRKDIYR